MGREQTLAWGASRGQARSLGSESSRVGTSKGGVGSPSIFKNVTKMFVWLPLLNSCHSGLKWNWTFTNWEIIQADGL